MDIISKIIEIPYTENITTDYIEKELKTRGIIPLRWAIVKISKDFFTINCAYDKIA